jgi:hypothetical protein
VSGLVVAGGVDLQFAQEFAGGGVDDAYVVVVGEQQDVGFRCGCGRCRCGVDARRRAG